MVEEVAWIVPSLPFTWTVFVGAATFLSLSAADPVRMASSMASLANAGFMGVLVFGYATDLGLAWGKTGGGGGGAVMAAEGGGELKTREAQVKDEDVEDPRCLSSSEATSLNFSSSLAASDLVFFNLLVLF